MLAKAFTPGANGWSYRAEIPKVTAGAPNEAWAVRVSVALPALTKVPPLPVMAPA